jgi:hypothetical protein
VLAVRDVRVVGCVVTSLTNSGNGGCSVWIVTVQDLYFLKQRFQVFFTYVVYSMHIRPDTYPLIL